MAEKPTQPKAGIATTGGKVISPRLASLDDLPPTKSGKEYRLVEIGDASGPMWNAPENATPEQVAASLSSLTLSRRR